MKSGEITQRAGRRQTGVKGRFAALFAVAIMVAAGPLGVAGFLVPEANQVAPAWHYDQNNDLLDDRIPQTFPVVSVIALYDYTPGARERNLLAETPGIHIVTQFETIPGFWLYVEQAALPLLSSMQGLARVEYDMPMSPLLDNAALAVKSRDSQGAAYDGTWTRDENGNITGLAGNGTRIAIIEGGIDYTHPSLDDFDGQKLGQKVDVFLDAFLYAAQDPQSIFGQPFSASIGPIGVAVPPSPVVPVCNPASPGYDEYLLGGGTCNGVLLPEPAPQEPLSTVLGTTVNDNTAGATQTLEDNGVSGAVADPMDPVDDAYCDNVGVGLNGQCTVRGNYNVGCTLVGGVPGCPFPDTDTGLESPEVGASAPAGEPKANFQPHATAMAGIAAGTGAISPLDASAPGEYTHAGMAPLASLADVNVFMPVGAAGKGPGFGVALTIAGVESIISWNAQNEGNPQYTIDVASLSIGTDDAGLGGEQTDEALDQFEATLGFRPVPAETASDGREALSQALDRLADSGVVVVVAAGQNHEYIVSPAATRKAITVGAVDVAGSPCRDDDLPFLGNDATNESQQENNRQGSQFKPELMAPGVGIVAPAGYDPEGTDVPNPQGYGVVQGTSASAAVVAGVAALVREAEPDFTAHAVKQAIIQGAQSRNETDPSTYHDDDVEGTGNDGGFHAADIAGWTPEWGFGYIDAMQATGSPPRLGTPVISQIDTAGVFDEVYIGDEIDISGSLYINDPAASSKYKDKLPCPPVTFTDGEPLANRVIRLALRENPAAPDIIGTIRTDAAGNFATTLRIPEDASLVGENNLYAIFDGEIPRETYSGIERAVSDGIPLFIKALAGVHLDMCFPADSGRSPCNQNAPVISYNGPGFSKLVRGFVRDQGNNPVPNMDVTVEWTAYDPVLEQAATTSVTGGEFLVEFPVEAPAGLYTVTGRIAGTEVLDAVNQTRTFAVAHNTFLALSAEPGAGHVFAPSDDPSSPVENQMRLVGRLTSVGGLAMPDRALEVVLSAVGEQVVAEPVTDENGRFTATIHTQRLNPGAYRAYVRFAGEVTETELGTEFPLYNPTSSIKVPFTVKPVPQLIVNDGLGARLERASVSGQLLTPQGGPIAESTVNVDVLRAGRIDSFEATTDRTGQFLVDFYAANDEPLGVATIVAHYPGSSRYAPVTETGTLVIESQPRIEFDTLDARRGQDTQLRGRLIDEAGNGVANQKILVRWQGVNLGTDRTDGQGEFVVDHYLPATEPLGPALTQAVYAGEGHYRSAVASRFQGVVADTTIVLEEPVIDGERALIRGQILDETGAPLGTSANLFVAPSNTAPAPVAWTMDLPIPAINTAERPQLVLEHAYDLLADEGVGQAAHVQASLDGGTSWLDLRPVGARPGQGGDINGASGGWGKETFDLAGFGGQDLQIALRFASDASRNATGWFVDELNVQGSTGPLFTEYFDGAVGSRSGPLGNDWSWTGWELGAPALSGLDGKSAEALGLGIQTPTENGLLLPARTGALVSPVFTVPSSGAPLLALVHAYEFRGNDGGVVQVRVDGSSTWQTLDKFDGTSSAMRGTSHGPTTDLYTLASYAGADVQLRMSYTTLALGTTPLPVSTGTVNVESITHEPTYGPGSIFVATDGPDTLHYTLVHPQGEFNLAQADAEGGYVLQLPAVDAANAIIRITTPDGVNIVDAPIAIGGYGWHIDRFTLMEITKQHAQDFAGDAQGGFSDLSAWSIDANGWNVVDAIPGDASQYSAVRGAAFNFPLLIGEENLVMLDGDGQALIDLPGPFPFFDDVVTAITVNEHGYVQPGDRAPLERPETIEASTASFIAPLWVDAIPAQTAVFSEVQHDRDGWTMLLQWTGIQPNGAADDGTVQMILRSDGVIAIKHMDTNFGHSLHDDGASAIVGLRGAEALYEIGDRSAPNSGTLHFNHATDEGFAGRTGLLQNPTVDGFATLADATVRTPVFQVPAEGAVLLVGQHIDARQPMLGTPFDDDGFRIAVADGTFVQAATPWGALSDDVTDAETVLVDLESFAGRHVAIAFEREGDATFQGRGWGIDDVTVASKNVLYDTDFATLLNEHGWTSEALPGRGTWKAGELAAANVPHRDGVAALSLSGPYPDGANTRLVSPVLSIPSTSNAATVGVTSWLETEGGRDGGIVEVSTDGVTWTPLERIGDPMKPVTSLEADGLTGRGAGSEILAYDLRGLKSAADVKLRVLVEGTAGPDDFFWGFSDMQLRDGAATLWTAGPAEAVGFSKTGTWHVLARDDDLYGVAHNPLDAERETILASGGSFLYEYTPARAELLGPHHLTFLLPARDQTITGSQTTLAFDITTPSHFTDVDLYHAAEPTVLVTNESFQFAGRLLDGLGRPVANQPVTVQFDDNVLAETTTNSFGSFQGTGILTGIQPGTGQAMTFVYAGSATQFIDAAADDVQFTAKQRISIDQDGNFSLDGDMLTIRTIVRGPDGEPLRNVPVMVEAGEYQTVLKTDRDGVLVATIPVQDIDRLTVSVSYRGDSEHLPVTYSQSAVLDPVDGDGGIAWWVWVLAATILVALIVAFVVLRSRRSPVAQVRELEELLERSIYELDTTDSVRATIYTIYGDFVTHLRRFGLRIPQSSTAGETLTAAVQNTPASETNLKSLTSLFEMARYSDLPMGEEHRREAKTGLMGVLNQLPRQDVLPEATE